MTAPKRCAENIFFHAGFVAYVGMDERHAVAGNRGNAFQHRCLAIAQTIDYDHFISSLDELYAGMGAYITGSTCYQYFHNLICP
jgi:hypothetical protein